MSLVTEKCVPCEGGVPKLTLEEATALLTEVAGWELEGGKVARTFDFSDFVTAMKFVNRLADVAEEEGHHPDFSVHYSQVTVSIWTHALGGLSRNDFILAKKIDALLE